MVNKKRRAHFVILKTFKLCFLTLKFKIFIIFYLTMFTNDTKPPFTAQNTFNGKRQKSQLVGNLFLLSNPHCAK